MNYKDIQDEETALQEDELVALKDVELTVVGDAELKEIEDHLKRLYTNNLVELYTEPSITVEFDRFVKRPLYIAALYFCQGNKKKAAKILGISADKLRNKLENYYSGISLSRFSLSESDNRMCVLYENYLEQILADSVSDKLAEIVDRAMYRAVMEFTRDSLTVASRLLGVTKPVLESRLDRHFGTRKLLGAG